MLHGQSSNFSFDNSVNFDSCNILAERESMKKKTGVPKMINPPPPPKKDKTKEQLFNDIITDISESGMSALSAMKGKMSSQTFYELLKEEENSNRYARACEMRAEVIADEAIEISDNRGNDLIILKDGREVVDNAVIQRDRLRVDTRKWLLAKLHPKKYGDKISTELTGAGGKDLNITFTRHEP